MSEMETSFVCDPLCQLGRYLPCHIGTQTKLFPNRYLKRSVGVKLHTCSTLEYTLRSVAQQALKKV